MAAANRCCRVEIHVLPSARFVHLGGGSSVSSTHASAAYLDSVKRYYHRPAAALAVVRLASWISLITLRTALMSHLRSRRVRDLYETFRQLQRVLRSTGEPPA